MFSYYKLSSGQESQPLGFEAGAVVKFGKRISYWGFAMSDHSHHGHHHNHSHGVSDYGRAFLISITLNTVFVAIEAGYGFVSHSLALIADAGHNLGDVLGLIVAWVATILVKRQPSTRWTFGLRRSSILAAFGNAAVLLIVSGGICLEAIQRIQKPEPIAGNIVMAVAVIGIVINTISALMFVSGSKEDLNLKGAFLHLASDALVSVGVALAGLAIVLTGQLWFDPVVSLIISAVIILGTWQLFRESLRLLMDAVPPGIEPTEVQRYLSQLSGVTEVHDLHIWAMSTTETSLMAHLVMPEGTGGDRFLAEVAETLDHQFKIHHMNLQIETGDPAFPCAQAPSEVL
jgi:cobalt-zinc-cadmium efflux system protein